MPNITNLDRTVGLLEKVLELRQQNQQVIAANIANADTPGYTPSRLEFEARLQQALTTNAVQFKTTHPAHFPVGAAGLDSVTAQVIRTPAPSPIGDGNGVDLEQEMVALAENQILYETATQLVSKKLGMLKYVAQEGR
ncbi:MAG: flagellar basal body rod protein FlgB [Desulfuromonadaceae bacterium]